MPEQPASQEDPARPRTTDPVAQRDLQALAPAHLQAQSLTLAQAVQARQLPQSAFARHRVRRLAATVDKAFARALQQDFSARICP